MQGGAALLDCVLSLGADKLNTMVFFFFQINLKNNVLSFLIISAGATSACIAKIICGSRRDFTIQILPIMLQFLLDQVTMVRCMFSIRGRQLSSISDAGIELLKYILKIFTRSFHFIS